ncbi:MAG: aromatic-ring-hydroxylating dioxygenase subunit beta [Rhodospirillaceae bacterium]
MTTTLAGLRLPADLSQADPRDLHFALDRMNADYALALDENELERWPDFFVEDGVYRVIPRENYEAGYPIAVMYCANRRMMADRVTHVRETCMFAPRRLRHVTGNVRVTGFDGRAARVQSNYAVFETTHDTKTAVFNVGKYVDLVVCEGGAPKLAERLCVYDSSIIPTSLIYPV